MWGPLSALSGDSMGCERGLTPRVFEQLFSRIKEVIWQILKLFFVSRVFLFQAETCYSILQEQGKHTDKELTYNCTCSFLEAISILTSSYDIFAVVVSVGEKSDPSWLLCTDLQ
jgi:kinesin family protein 15